MTPKGTTHELKTWPDPFEAIRDGRKRYEIREEFDRTFTVGDDLRLREFEPHEACAGSGRVWDNGDKTDCGCEKPHGKYTGREILALITYKTEGGDWGIRDGQCVLGIKVLKA